MNIAPKSKNLFSIKSIVSILLFTYSFSVYSAVPGLPFTEDLSANNLADTTQTNALWSTASKSVKLPASKQLFGSMQAATTTTLDLESTANGYFIHTGDFNGDGEIDVITSRSGGTKLYLHNNTITPYSDTAINIGSSAYDLAIGDLNKDGLPDLAVADGFVKVFINNGTATPFTGQGLKIESIDYLTTSIAIGDINGDGNIDIVTGGFQLANRFYLNNGTSLPFKDVNGTFIDPEISDETRSVVLADVNNDGLTDLIAGNDGADNLLYLNNGSADTPFTSATDISLTNLQNTNEIFLIDINNDGYLDLIEGNYNQQNLYILNTKSDTQPFGIDTTVAEIPIGTETNSSSRAITAGDIDNDGDIDIISGNSGQQNLVYFNNGSSTPFADAGQPHTTLTDSTFSIHLTDIDKDNDLDLLEATFTGSDKIHYNDANNNVFNNVVAVSANTDILNSRSVKLADIDKDGYPDLIKGHFNSTNRIYYHNGTSNPFSAAGTTITGDSQPTQDIEYADIDNDGDIDIIVGNYSLSIPNRFYQNNGSGVFTGFDITADADNTWNIELADVDNDGDLDVFVANRTTTNKIYINDGDSTPFSTGTVLNVSSDSETTYDLVLNDFNKDGFVDVAVANYGQANKIYFSSGTPTPFDNSSVGQTVSLDTENSSSISVSDLNNDGLMDIIIGNYGQSNKYYLNDGDITPFDSIAGATISSETNNTYDIVVMDFNKDGSDDIVSVNYTSQLNRVYINQGTDNGLFNSNSGFDLSPDTDNSFSITTGDVNRDGNIDLVVGNLTTVSDKIYLSQAGSNAFTGLSDAPIGTNSGRTINIVIGDINNDGNPDVITGGENESNYATLNNGSETPFVGATSYTVLNGATYIDLADLDNDGDLDYIAGYLDAPNRIVLNDGSPNPFDTDTGYTLQGKIGRTTAAIAGDLNNDGLVDIIFSSSSVNQHQLYINDGNSSPFSTLANPTVFGPTGSRSMKLADFNNDGYLDLVLGNSANSNSELYLNNKTTNPFNVVAIPLEAGYTQDITVGDINRDGKLDMVFANSGTSGSPGQINRLLLNTGTLTSPAFTPSNITSNAFSTRSVSLADIDHDGDLDLLAGNGYYTAERNKIYYNNGTGTPFSTAVGTDIKTNSFNTWNIHAADMNNDGTLDIVTSNTWLNRIYIRNHYKTPTAEVRSIAVDNTVDDIFRATLTPIETKPDNTDIDYYLSNNGGGTYFQVTPGSMFNFPTTGSDLRWKATLTSLSTTSTPVINGVHIEGNELPQFSGFPTLVGNAKVGNTIAIVGVTATDPENDSVSISYQWQSNNVDISGATTDSLNIDQTLAHTSLRCVVTLDDGFGGSVSNPTPNVLVANTKPVANIDFVSTSEDTGFTTIDLVADNDTDADGDTLTVFNVTSPSTNGGTVINNGNGTFTYTPANNFFGLDTFAYQINDGNGGISSATVNVVVNSVNDAPVISGTPATTATPNSTYTFLPVASDNDGDALIYLISNKPDWATFDTATGTFAGIPADSDYGTESNIQISVTDGVATTPLLPAFNIDVGDNKAPVVSADLPAGDYNADINVTLSCTDSGSGCQNIYFTTDGITTPIVNPAMLYTTPVTITDTTLLQFIATDNTNNTSGVSSVDYQFDRTVPVVAITTPNAEFMAEVLLISGTTSDAASGINKVELQITDGTNSVIEVNGTAALVPFPAEWVSATETTGTWNYLTSFSWSENKTYTVTARATDNAGNTAETTTSFTYYTAAPSFTEIPQLVLSSQTILQNETLTISGILQFPGNEGFDMSALPIDITVQDPNAVINNYATSTYDNAGHFTVTINAGADFALKGTYIIKASFAGDIRLQATTSVGSTILVGSSAGYAVIVQGKLENDEGLDSHNKSANRVYSTLIERGFLPENIRYFNYDDTQAGVYATPTKAGLQDAIENWLPSRVNGSPAPMYIVGVDHGNDDLFYLDTERLNSTELDTMLDNLEGALSVDAQVEPRVLIYGACYSGSFIPNVSAPGRVIITSAADDEESYKGAEEPDGVRVGEYFLEEYFKEMRNGYSLKEAFETATERTEIYTREGTDTNSVNAYFDDAVQHPLLDDNGDAAGSNELSDQAGADGDVTKDMYLGAGLSLDTNSAENPATFVDVTDSTYLDSSTSTALLWGVTNVPAVEVTAAWFEIRIPTKVLVAQGGTNQLTNDLIRVDMTYNATAGRWEGSYDQFTSPGTYEVYYFAQDSATNKISTALISNVYKQEVGNQAPVAFQLLAPANGSQQNVVLALDWEDSVDPDGDNIKYNLLVADDNSFTNIIHSQYDLSSSSTYIDYEANLPKSNATLYWKVEAIDIYGSVTTSPVFTFDTDSPNSTPGVIQGLVYASTTFAQISGATVSSDNGDIVLTEYNGQFIMITSAENVKLTSSSTGYDSTVLNDVDVVPGEVVEVNIEMKLPTEDAPPPVDTPPPADSGGGGGGVIHYWLLLLLSSLMLLRRRK